MITNKPRVLELVKHFQPTEMIPHIINLNTACADEVSKLFNHSVDMMLQVNEINESNINYLCGVYDCVGMALDEDEEPYIIVFIMKQAELSADEKAILDAVDVPIHFVYGSGVAEAVSNGAVEPTIIDLTPELINFSEGLGAVFSSTTLAPELLTSYRDSFMTSLNRMANDYNVALVDYKNLVEDLKGQLAQAQANADKANGMYQTEVNLRTQLESEVNSLKAQIKKLTAQVAVQPPDEVQPSEEVQQPVNPMAQQLNNAGQTTEQYTMAPVQPTPQPVPQPTPAPQVQVVPALDGINLVPFNPIQVPNTNMFIRDKLPVDILSLAPTLYGDATPANSPTKFIQCFSSKQFYFFDPAQNCWVHWVQQ